VLRERLRGRRRDGPPRFQPNRLRERPVTDGAPPRPSPAGYRARLGCRGGLRPASDRPAGPVRCSQACPRAHHSSASRSSAVFYGTAGEMIPWMRCAVSALRMMAMAVGDGSCVGRGKRAEDVLIISSPGQGLASLCPGSIGAGCEIVRPRGDVTSPKKRRPEPPFLPGQMKAMCAIRVASAGRADGRRGSRPAGRQAYNRERL